MNVHQILDWVKANVLIVVFCVVIIAAPITMFIVAGGMNKAVRDDVQKRGASMSQLQNISVTMPTGEQIVPTEELLSKYQEVSKALADDATAVQTRAVEFNRKGRDVLMPGVFPEPPFDRRQIVPKDFHDRLLVAFDNLLKDAQAGSPPNLESLRAELEGMRNRFIAQDLKKDPNAALDASEVARLEKLLSDARIGKYKTAAASVGMYADASALFIPAWDQSRIPTPSEMFNWQWQFWAVSDVLNALANANKGSTSVAVAPVKRLLGVVVSGLPAVAGASKTDGGEASAPRLSGGFGDGEQQPPPEESSEEGDFRVNTAAAAKGPITRDFSASLSGLVSGPLLDVLTVDMAIVVEAARLPEVLDVISRHNFNTIINLRVESADAFAATEQGFYYGGEPVNLVTIRMQTVWLREWTKQFMPPETRTALGIPPDAPARASDEPPPAP